MKINEINETLFSQAKSLGMCADVHKAWYGRVFSVNELFNLYYRNQDFCIENGWPEAGLVRMLSTEEERLRNGVLADDNKSLLNPPNAVVMGQSKGIARYNGFNVGRISVMDNASCDIFVKGHARVSVHVYGKASVHVATEDGARTTVLLHSNDCAISTTGQTAIKECLD